VKENSQQEAEEMLAWIDEKFIKSMSKVHCLALIAKGHTHGYDMMKYIEKQYGLKISAGSYYPLLQWLEEKGYIRGVWEHVDGKPSKKTYEVTKRGINVLNAAKKRLMVLVQGLSAERRTQKNSRNREFIV